MALSIKHPEADRLARELAATTGESVTEAVVRALRERLTRERAKAPPAQLRGRFRAIRKKCSALPVLDNRSPDDLIGYDDHGLPR